MMKGIAKNAVKNVRNVIDKWKETREQQRMINKQIEDKIDVLLKENIDRFMPPICKTCSCIIGMYRDKKSYRAHGICRHCEQEFEHVIETVPKYANSTVQDLVDAIEVMTEMAMSEGVSHEIR